MSHDTGLSQNDLEKILSVFALHPQVSSVKIFGSRALGTYRNGSDIDLAICGESINFNLMLQISAALDDLNPPYSFDLVHLQELTNVDLKNHIEKFGTELLPLPKK